VKRSGYKDAGNGLFACVDIPVNESITVYMGNEKDEVNENRNYMFKTNWKYKKHTSGDLKWDNTRKSTSKTKKYERGTMIDAVSDDKNSWDSGDELYLGAHMINDACHGDRTTVLKKYNSEIYSRCEIISTCEIKKGDEITFDYNKKVTTKRERKGDKKSKVRLSDEGSESDSRNADDLCSDTLRNEG